MQKLAVIYTRVSRVWEEARFTVEVPDGATKAQIKAAAQSYREEHGPEFKEIDSETMSVTVTSTAA